MTRETVRRVAVGFLALESFGGVLWWGVMLTRPAARAWFLAARAPDATLLAFSLPDVVLFMGGAGAAAWGLARHKIWAWPVLCIHAGAAAYAALYCLSLTFWTGGAKMGAMFMLPCLFVLPLLVWRLRPGQPPCE